MRFLRNKAVLAGISVAVAAAILATVFVALRQGGANPIAQLDSDSASSARTVSVPPITRQTSGASAEKENAGSQAAAALDVGGNPVKQTAAGGETAANQNGSTGSGSSKSGTASTAKGPTTTVSQQPDGTQSKTSTANPNNPADGTADGWTPPPPGVGTGALIGSGSESVKIDTNPSVETLQRTLGLLVGSQLQNDGYTTLYPNAGSVRDLVESAIQKYADTGAIQLDTSSWGLPSLVGYYNVRVSAQGSNAAEAAIYIADYMEKDFVFNDKVSLVFNVAKDGWLSVYQKDGYFYILFAVVDKGYSSFG